MVQCKLNEVLSIKYNDVEYKTRLLHWDDGTTTEVAGESLDEALTSEYGTWKDAEARVIDECIYCYVPDDKLDLPHDELLEYVQKEVD